MELFPHRPPDPLRGRRAGKIGDAEGCQRVEDGVGDGRKCADGSGLAAAFDAERVGRAGRAVEAEVEIDPDTGQVILARYTAVDDYGVLVNPMIATGQAHGAIAQGVGQALLEHAVYDPASGQLVAGSLMDYALPRADDLLSYDLGFNGTRCTTNPLGVKGCGEAGTVGAFPAVTNAILDALAPLGISDFAGPATPERIWHAMWG